MDDYQTLDTDPTEQGVSSEEGVENVDSGSEDSSNEASAPALTLEQINSALGRTGSNAYRSLEDAEKGLKNLTSFVGKKVEAPKLSAEDRYGYMAQEIFALKTPDATGYLDVVIPYAKANKLTLSEAWETKFADTFAVKESPKDATVIKSTRQVGAASPNELAKKIENMSATELRENYSSIMQSQE
jgi:hypothetical protein